LVIFGGQRAFWERSLSSTQTKSGGNFLGHMAHVTGITCLEIWGLRKAQVGAFFLSFYVLLLMLSFFISHVNTLLGLVMIRAIFRRLKINHILCCNDLDRYPTKCKVYMYFSWYFRLYESSHMWTKLFLSWRLSHTVTLYFAIMYLTVPYLCHSVDVKKLAFGFFLIYCKEDAWRQVGGGGGHSFLILLIKRGCLTRKKKYIWLGL
jgi:hypothetical protein